MNPKEQPDKEQPERVYQDFPHLKGECENCGSYLGKHRLKDDACPGKEPGNFLKTKFKLQEPAASGGEDKQDELWEQAAKKLFNHHNPDLRGATDTFHRLMDGFRKDMNLLASDYIIQKRKP